MVARRFRLSWRGLDPRRTNYVSTAEELRLHNRYLCPYLSSQVRLLPNSPSLPAHRPLGGGVTRHSLRYCGARRPSFPRTPSVIPVHAVRRSRARHPSFPRKRESIFSFSDKIAPRAERGASPRATGELGRHRTVVPAHAVHCNQAPPPLLRRTPSVIPAHAVRRNQALPPLRRRSQSVIPAKAGIHLSTFPSDITLFHLRRAHLGLRPPPE